MRRLCGESNGIITFDLSDIERSKSRSLGFSKLVFKGTEILYKPYVIFTNEIIFKFKKFNLTITFDPENINLDHHISLCELNESVNKLPKSVYRFCFILQHVVRSVPNAWRLQAHLGLLTVLIVMTAPLCWLMEPVLVSAQSPCSIVIQHTLRTEKYMCNVFSTACITISLGHLSKNLSKRQTVITGI